jgi:hypothetical protein
MREWVLALLEKKKLLLKLTIQVFGIGCKIT